MCGLVLVLVSFLGCTGALDADGFLEEEDGLGGGDLLLDGWEGGEALVMGLMGMRVISGALTSA